MKVKGLNECYDVEIKKTKFQGDECVLVTRGNLMTGMTSVMISKDNWGKLKEGVK